MAQSCVFPWRNFLWQEIGDCSVGCACMATIDPALASCACSFVSLFSITCAWDIVDIHRRMSIVACQSLSGTIEGERRIEGNAGGRGGRGGGRGTRVQAQGRKTNQRTLSRPLNRYIRRNCLSCSRNVKHI